jgi:hypothetical protein
MSEDILRIAHRVWAEQQGSSKRKRKSRAKGTRQRHTPKTQSSGRREAVLVEPTSVLFFDTETTRDRSQALMFGVWRYCTIGERGFRCIDEGIFHADDLATTDPAGLELLQKYVKHHRAATQANRQVRLMSRSEFVNKVFYPAAYHRRARVVGFNLPFDLSRLAIGVKEGRDNNFGGFSFILSGPKKGTRHTERKHRARVRIKHLDSKAAFISFGKPLDPDEIDLIPEGSVTQLPDPTYVWHGRFLDLRTLAFALTGTSYSLAGACSAFGVEGKSESGGFGVITEEHIDYCRQDVAATSNLYEALMAEFRLHPIALAPERAYSPASLSKAYLAAMGIEPLLKRHPGFSREVLGYAMAAFYGGRAECRIRRTPVPVILVDFTSMYPTVDALMDLHRLQIATSIQVTECTEDVRQLLESVTLDDCFNPDIWPQLVGFALVEPDGDVLPVRASYDGKTWGIGVNPITSSEPLWYSLADCVDSKLTTGKAPKVLRAVRLVPVGIDSRLRSVRLRGSVEVDPMVKDPMMTMVEERQRVKKDTTLPKDDNDRLANVLKIVANAGAYGIYSEFNPKERRKGFTVPVLVHGRRDPFFDRVAAPEDPGKYCFPPFASCITGAARLMLGMLERSVTDLGGTWAFCDTDSMAIVATEHGGLVSCRGGSERSTEGGHAVRALTAAQVEAIRQKFGELNPYDPLAVSDVLKVEAVSHCFAISAKRYALYNLDNKGSPVMVEGDKSSRHGLGHFMNPDDLDTDNQEWIKSFWRVIIQRAHGLNPELPPWIGRPTAVQTTISSPPILRAFRHINAGLSYARSIKPFNFVLTAAGAKPPASVMPGQPFRLVAPFESDPRRWEDAEYVNIHDPEADPYAVTTRDGRPGMARVDTFADVLGKYETHPEAKSLGPDGEPCGRATVGLLQRRPVTVGKIVLIGKESNRLDERSRGELTADDVDERITTYKDHDEWYRVVVPRLREEGAKAVAETTGVSERRARDWLTGKAVPHAGRQVAGLRIL